MENCVTESANVQEPAGNWTWWPWSLVGLESTIPISEICDNYICLTISDQSKIGANGEMVKIHKGEGNYIFSVICCWKVLKCILDSIFDTNRSFRRPLIFGKENRLNPWHNAVFILIKEAESCILFMKLLNYIQKYLHWSWVYCPWKIFKRWHIFKVFELLFSVWAEQTVVVYPASEPSKLPFFYNSPPISTENNHYSVEPETDHDADAGANFIAKLRVTGKQCRFKR